MAAPQNYVSVSRRPPDIEDYIDMVRRHRSWIVGPTFAGLVIAVVVAFLWPDTFESIATMRITPQIVSERVVPDTINMQISQRLEGMRTEIMSRSYLNTLISDPKLKLYPKLVQKYTLEDAYSQMQKDVKISIIDFGTGDRRYASSFQIKFSYPDKYKAQAVVQSLVTQFMNKNVEVQSQSAKETQEFVSARLKDAKDTLDGIQADIAKFRSENLGKLPEQANYNATELSSLHLQLNTESERLARVQESKNSLETQLSTRTQLLNIMTQSADENEPSQMVKNQSLIDLNNAIRNQQMQIAALKELYTPEWPQVKSAEAQLRSLIKDREQETAKQEQEAANAPAQTKRVLSVQQQAQLEAQKGEIASIKTSIANLNNEIQQVTQAKGNIEKRIADVQAKIEASPLIDQQWAQLTQDLTTARERYDDLKRREATAETSKDLQDRGVGEQLVLLDPASLPQTPSDPNRYLITGVGTGIGLMLGLVMAGIKEAKDTSLKNLKDVRAYTNLPVLSSIPLLENALLVRRKRRLVWLAWSTAVIVGAMAMIGSWSYYVTPRGQ